MIGHLFFIRSVRYEESEVLGRKGNSCWANLGWATLTFFTLWLKEQKAHKAWATTGIQQQQQKGQDNYRNTTQNAWWVHLEIMQATAHTAFQTFGDTLESRATSAAALGGCSGFPDGSQQPDFQLVEQVSFPPWLSSAEPPLPLEVSAQGMLPPHLYELSTIKCRVQLGTKYFRPTSPVE